MNRTARPTESDIRNVYPVDTMLTDHRIIDLDAGRLRALRDERARIDLLGWMAVAHEREYGEDGHGQRVGVLAGEIARATGLPAEAVRRVSLAATLHDIGKLGIPRSILAKEGALRPVEMAEVRRHTTMGAAILRGAGRSPELRVAASVAYTHHERWDGTGYHGYRRHEVPLASRIVSVADVYDALVNTRCYKRAWNPHDAIEEIGVGAGTRFDPDVVDALLSVVVHA